MIELRPNPFETLEPPPGGLARLRSRIERDRRRRRLALGLQGAVAGAVVVGLLAWVTGIPRSPAPPMPELEPARLALGLSPTPAEVVSISPARRHEMAAVRVAVPTQRVVIYRVASLRDPDDPD